VSSEVGVSDAIRLVQNVQGISAAKVLPDGTWVRIAGLAASRMGEGSVCFLEELDRCSGIEAKGTWYSLPYIQPGTMTDVFGCMASESNTRVISGAEFRPSLVGSPLRPLGMPNKFVGGGAFGFSQDGRLTGQAGSTWGAGVNNVGLLVSVWGKVIDRDSDSFTLDDGSLPDGIRVRCFNLAAPPEIGHLVRVTGIATPQGVSVYDPEDIDILR
jgi:hypothetical protein